MIDDPSKRVINLPVSRDANGQIEISLPKGPAVRPPKVIASCNLKDLNVQVIKENGQRRARIRQVKDGQESQRIVPFVIVEKLTKEMLGQYAAAVVVAQQLGITEVDYIKVFLVDPQVQLQDTKALVFFYDTDDDVIEKTLITGNRWDRCMEEE